MSWKRTRTSSLTNQNECCNPCVDLQYLYNAHASLHNKLSSHEQRLGSLEENTILIGSISQETSALLPDSTSFSIGKGSSQSQTQDFTLPNYNIAIGSKAITDNESDNGRSAAIAIGFKSSAYGEENNSGSSTSGPFPSDRNSISIGTYAESSSGSVCMGNSSKVLSMDSIIIGNNSNINLLSVSSIAIGPRSNIILDSMSSTGYYGNILLGPDTLSKYSNETIAIGNSARVDTANAATAIGTRAQVKPGADGSTALGVEAVADEPGIVQLGNIFVTKAYVGVNAIATVKVPQVPPGTAPTVTPDFIGQIYIDTASGGTAYIAVGTSNSDWKPITA